MIRGKARCIIVLFLLGAGLAGWAHASAPEAAHADAPEFPRTLESYDDAGAEGIGAILANRIRQEPFNLVASLIFLCAIVHTFLTSRFLAIAPRWEEEHKEKIKQGLAHKHSVHIPAGIVHFLGEVEVVFGLWAVALGAAIFFFHDWHTFVGYIGHKVNFTEALFVVVIMTLASTRPILKLAEMLMRRIARILGGTLAPRFGALIRFQVDRTRELFREGRPLVLRSGFPAAFYFATVWLGGRAVLRMVREQGERVMFERPTITVRSFAGAFLGAGKERLPWGAR